MRLPMKRVLAVLLLLGLTACRETFRKAETIARPGSEPKMFRTVDVPMLLDTPEQRAEYVAKNYWNHFDFSDTSYVDLPEVTEQAFADYVNLLGQMHGELASQSVRITLSKAEADSAMYGYFVELFEKYLYDPNSPMRNEELYIPALEAMIASERLGEADKVRAAGGLFIVGTERHESRRIDNQLRGRSGRQGDPGESRFYLSLEDDILRLFGTERIMGLMETLGIDEDTPIEQKMLSGAIENAQKRVESKNFQSRKTVLEYDDVMNTQREVIYKQRREVLDGKDLKDSIQAMLENVVTRQVTGHPLEHEHYTAEDYAAITAPFRGTFLDPGDSLSEATLADSDAQSLTAYLLEKAQSRYAQREAEFGEAMTREIERVVMLRVVDEYWMDHIDAMTELRQGIGLRAYGQADPKVEYKREGYEMFEAMVAAIQEETVRRMFLVRLKKDEEVKRERVAKVTSESGASDGTVKAQPKKAADKIGRNDPCPCGSGLKWKKCTCKEYHPEEN